MSRFKRLTDAEARTLTRRELLDRIEAEQAYWFRKKKSMSPEDDAAFREFSRLLRTYLSPASIAEAMQDTIDHIEGRSPGGYWDTRPGEEIPRLPPMDDNQRAGLDSRGSAHNGTAMGDSGPGVAGLPPMWVAGKVSTKGAM